MPKRLFFTLFTRSLSTRSYFQFSSDLGRSKGVLLSFFCVLDEYLTLKHTFHDPHSKLLNLAFFDLVILDNLDLAQGHKRLSRVLKNIPDMIHVVPSTLFQFDAADLPGEASKDR